MPRYLFAICILVLLSVKANAQSITIAELAKELGAPFSTVTQHLQAKGFSLSGSGTFNNTGTIRFQKKIGEGIENVACFAADTARKIPAGVTYSYNKKSYTNGLVGELKRSSFVLKQTTSDPKRSIQIFQDARFEATITTYADVNAFTSVTVRLRYDKPVR